MAERWYYARGGERHGPVTTAQLKELAAGGAFAASDLVWQDGMAEWTPASNAKGLFPEGSVPPPLPAARTGPPPLSAQAPLTRTGRPAIRTPRARRAVQDDDRGAGVAVASLVLGIAGLIAWIIPLAGFPVTITAVVCGAKGLKTHGRSMAIAGLVTGIIGLCLTTINSLVGAMMGMNSAGYQPPAW